MTSRSTTLYLHEEIMLLALRDEEGTVNMGSMHMYAVAGAIMTELLLAGRITVEEGKKNMVNLERAKPMGEPILDECLAKVAAAKRRATLQTWVQRVAGMKNLHHRVAHRLCARNILQADEKSVLLIFTRKIYPEVNPGPERRLIRRLEKAVFTDSARVEMRTALLVSLANGAGLLAIPFDKKELKKRKKRLEQIANGDLMGKATAQAIQAAQTAIMVACIMPAIITTTVISH